MIRKLIKVDEILNQDWKIPNLKNKFVAEWTKLSGFI